jgi:hypothetical protein
MFPPAGKVPQFMELRGAVQALLEYTPKFADVVTWPFVCTFCDVLIAANVVRVKASAMATKIATDVVIESFIFGVFCPQNYRTS